MKDEWSGIKKLIWARAAAGGGHTAIRFEVGAINASTGKESSSTNRIRNIGYIPIDDFVSMYADTGYEFSPKIYKGTDPDDTANFFDYNYSWRTNIITGEEIKADRPNAAYVRIVANIVGNTGTITQEMLEDIVSHLHITTR